MFLALKSSYLVHVRNEESVFDYDYDSERTLSTTKTSLAPQQILSKTIFYPTVPPHHPDLEGLFNIIYSRVHELFSESLTTISSEGNAAIWDQLKRTVNEAME